MEKTLEKKTSDAILQEPLTVTLGGRAYEVAQPSLGTLIMLSSKISELPAFRREGKVTVSDMLADAEDARTVAEAVAVMILGAKELKKRSRFGLRADRLRKLTDTLLTDATPAEMFTAATSILRSMQVEDFFGLTTFLREVSLTRATREVVPSQTASGQSSQASQNHSGAR